MGITINELKVNIHLDKENPNPKLDVETKEAGNVESQNLSEEVVIQKAVKSVLRILKEQQER